MFIFHIHYALKKLKKLTAHCMVIINANYFTHRICLYTPEEGPHVLYVVGRQLPVSPSPEGVYSLHHVTSTRTSPREVNMNCGSMSLFFIGVCIVLLKL